MKERPILFSAPMVNAIRDGRKTQTRRIAKKMVRHPDLGNLYTPGALVLEHDPQHVIERACPYGQTGDRLWVRESWRACRDLDRTKPREIEPGSSIEYEATARSYAEIGLTGKLRPSIFMPKWASRITLEITAIRVERLQDISETDAIAEGAPWSACGAPQEGSHKAGYAKLWESLNGSGSWSDNPWVWVVEFRRLKP